MKTRLTIEESQELIKLGVPEGMASLHTETLDKSTPTGLANVYHRVESKSIFTLADLLDILPKSYFSEEYYDTMNLSIEVLNGKWFVNYRYYCGGELAAQDVEKESPELIDALYQLLIWCIDEKHISF